MYLYNKGSMIFLARVQKLLEKVLVQDLGLRWKKSYVLYSHYWYHLRTVIFDRTSDELGFFCPHTFTIGISRRLEAYDDEWILSIIGHEVAHFLTFASHGHVSAHGKEFREICTQFNLPHHATIELPPAPPMTENTSKVIQKIQKLLSLATSQNQHESERAMEKALELLTKYKIEEFSNPSLSFETFVLPVYQSARRDSKAQAISDIIAEFYVTPIFTGGRGKSFIEVVGRKDQVQLAEYIAGFLDRELDRLWDEARGNHRTLKGLRAKNSFFRGVAKGQVSKLKSIRSQFLSPQLNALIVSQKNESLRLAFPHLSHVTSRTRGDSMGRTLGEEAGKKMTIRRPLESRKNSLLLIN